MTTRREVHHDAGRRGGVAARGARAAGGDADQWLLRTAARVPPGLARVLQL